MSAEDAHYLKTVLDPIRVCAHYKPKFGQGAKGGGLTLAQFQSLYGADPFYGWFGLDNPLMYAAHKAAGGMTSVYRQIGIGCEKMFRRVLASELGLSAVDVVWSYDLPLPSGKTRTLHLDGRVPLDAIQDGTKRERFRAWMREAASHAGVSSKLSGNLTGFEAVRQSHRYRLRGQAGLQEQGLQAPERRHSERRLRLCKGLLPLCRDSIGADRRRSNVSI